MLKKVAWMLAISMLAFLVVAQFLPREHRVQRTIVVEQPASLVFTLLNGYGHFNEWSPWAARDASARYSVSGPGFGAGARLDWQGDPRIVGTGWQRITFSEPYRRIDMQLDFGEQGTANSSFLIEEVQGGTELQWQFRTDVTEGKGYLGRVLGRYFGLFLEKWIGDDYEQGLAAFKQYAETFPGTDFAAADIKLVEAEAREILYVEGQSGHDPDEVAQALASAFGEVIRFLAEQEIELAGQPMAITRHWDDDRYFFEAALPVSRLPESTNGRVMAGMSPQGRAVRLVHTGPYDQMRDAYDELSAWMAAHRIEAGEVSWEHYISDPGNTPAQDLVTHIYFLVAN